MSKKLKIHDGDTPAKTFEVKPEYPKQKEATMSDIWHTADEIPPEDSYVVVKLHSGKCEVGFEFEYDFDNIEKWAFLDDLLALESKLDRTRTVLDKGMEHITGLNNMIESWYKLLQSDKDASTKYAILKSAISAYVETKGGKNE